MDVLIDGEIVLYGTVGDLYWGEFFTAKDVVTALAQLGRSTDVTVRINSGGGIVDEGIAIFNAFKAHGGFVTVYIDSMAASSASMIAMAGDDIVMRSGSIMMIHDPAGITIGNAADHEKSLESLNVYGDAAAEIYADQTGRSIEECRAEMREEIWLGAEEAVARGYADRVEGAVDKPAAMFNYRIFKHAPEPIVALADKREWPKADRKRAAKSAAKQRHKEVSMANDHTADKNPADAAAQVQMAVTEANAKAEAEKVTAVSDAKKTADASARERCKAILASDEAKGREAQAHTLAFDTDLSVEQAVAVLKTGAKATAAVGDNRFAAAMDANGNPKVGADGGGDAEDTDEAVAKRIVALHPNFKRSA